MFDTVISIAQRDQIYSEVAAMTLIIKILVIALHCLLLHAATLV